MLGLILAVAFWGFFHSFNASIRVKDFYRRRIGESHMKYYRLFYNFIAVVTFLPIIASLVLFPGDVAYRISAPWSYLMIAGRVLFAGFLITALFQFGILYFIGLRQLVQAEGERELVRGGFYRYVRHPFYTFALLFLWLSPLVTFNLLLVYIVLSVYIYIGIIFEERKLSQEFGEAYSEYRATTPMLIPGLKFRGNKWVSRFVIKQQTPDKV
jgi:protein-S-isoprenylcysteine O-methyltransferase Ste14